MSHAAPRCAAMHCAALLRIGLEWMVDSPQDQAVLGSEPHACFSSVQGNVVSHSMASGLPSRHVAASVTK